MAKNQEFNDVIARHLSPDEPSAKVPIFTVAPRPVGDIYTSRVFALREVRDYTQRLVGSLLDLLDASVTDPRQRAAMRKLIMRECWETHYRVAQEWADREVSLEMRDGIPVQSWRDVDNFRATYPTPCADWYNVFPFSVTSLVPSGEPPVIA